jgi:hypothetical protein
MEEEFKYFISFQRCSEEGNTFENVELNRKLIESRDDISCIEDQLKNEETDSITIMGYRMF